MSAADSKHFLHLIHAVVTSPNAGSAAWIEASGVPRPSAFRLLRPLRFHGAIDGNQADPRAVLRLAADLRKDRAVPTHVLYRSQQVERMPIERAQLAFHSAANAYGFFEEGVPTYRISTEDAKQLLPGVMGSGSLRAGVGPFELEAPRRALAILYAEELERYPEPTKLGDRWISDPFVTYIDLLSHPRAGAHAAFFDQVLVRAGLLPERE